MNRAAYEEFEQLQHDREVRRSWIARGINDASRHLLGHGAGAAAKVIKKAAGHKREASKSEEAETSPSHKTTTVGGVTTTATDYPMCWPHLSPSTMDSTHELTYNEYTDFEKGFLYVSGMMDNQLARVSMADPTRKQFFEFEKSDNGMQPQPHTVRFDGDGGLWVGLEYSGIIVKVNMEKLFDRHGKMHPTQGDIPPMATVKKADYLQQLDVRILPTQNGSIPRPINTHPHGFCFDKDFKHIWFTGKLTNTVGRISVHGKNPVAVHYQLPTLGAVPIYLSLGCDNNVWGTCLTNNMVFRVTAHGKNVGVVTEIPITPTHADRRPIAIKPAPPNMGRYMWFSSEQGHKVGRIDMDELESILHENDDKSAQPSCTCSSVFYRRAPELARVVTEFAVPMTQRNMLMAGLAFDADGNLWTQSYVDPATAVTDLAHRGPDYIVRICKTIHEATSSVDENNARLGWGNISNVPISFFELPTRDAVLHRIICGPDGRVWFTELGADRIGTVTIEQASQPKHATAAAAKPAAGKRVKRK